MRLEDDPTPFERERALARLPEVRQRAARRRWRRGAAAGGVLALVVATAIVVPLTLVGASGHLLRVRPAGPSTSTVPDTAPASSTPPASAPATTSPGTVTAPSQPATGPSTPPASATPPPASTTPASTTSPSSTTPPTSTAGGAPTCDASQLRGTTQPLSGAGGRESLDLVLTNESGNPCSMNGFPGVELLSATGSVVANASRGCDYLPCPTTPVAVTLAPQASAHATLVWRDNPMEPAQTSCPASAVALVTPPNAFDQINLPLTIAPCGIPSVLGVGTVQPGS